MVQNKLKLYPYHSFLVIPFIVLFLYAHNLEQTSPFMTYRTLVLGLVATLVFYGIFYLLFRSRLKAGVFITFLLFILFQYGVLYEFFERLYFNGYWPFKNIHRYLLFGYALTLLILFWLTLKTRHDFVKINYFLNFLVVLLLCYNLILIVTSRDGDTRGKDSGKNIATNVPSCWGTGDLPNIYFIILDGYASNAVLKKFYNFNNEEFTSKLKKLGFAFQDSAFANYYYTAQSLCATLNMDYLSDTLNVIDRLRRNVVFDVLKKSNYKIYHLYSGYAVTSQFPEADSTITIDGPKEFEKSLLKYTILRLDDLFGFFAYMRLNSQFTKMHEFVRLSGKPKFCFMHFVAPHPPYVFDRDGKLRTKHQFAEHSWESKDFYLDQLVYVNKKISGLLTEIVKTDPKALVIIQSDHGPWVTATEKSEVFDARSQMLYAYYPASRLNVPQRTSAVNTFRYVFNNLFNCNLSTLPDEYAGKESLLRDPILLKKTD